MKKALAGTLLVLVLAGASALGWYWYRGKSAEGEVRYRTAKVVRGPIAAVVVASGTLNAVSTVQVGSQISGQVQNIYTDFNTAVKKDQIIARIDPSTFELRVNQARADVDAAESAVAAARSGQAAAQVSSALAALKQRQSLLRQAQVELERTIIRAPVDGTVILRNVDAGQTVAAGLQAPVLFTIAQDLRDMQVEAAIDELDVGRLRTGLGASFSVDAFPRRSFSGEIRQIRKSPGNLQNVVSYTLVISAANADFALLPGMTANVRVTVDSRPSVLKLPNAALRFRPAGTQDAKPAAQAPAQAGGGRVWVLQEGAPAPIDVRLGLTDGSSTEIVYGPLAEGAEVIVGDNRGGATATPDTGGGPRGRQF
jgi:HlyD family secretion protein